MDQRNVVRRIVDVPICYFNRDKNNESRRAMHYQNSVPYRHTKYLFGNIRGRLGNVRAVALRRRDSGSDSAVAVRVNVGMAVAI